LTSRNAFRHGLSILAHSDPVTLVKVDAIVHALAGKDAAEDRLISAADLTRVQFELLRIRSTRAEVSCWLRLQGEFSGNVAS
jgi:hypothetical protein